MSDILRLILCALLGMNVCAQGPTRFEDLGGSAPLNRNRLNQEQIVDLDGDGAPDLMYPHANGFQVAWNSGDGSFTPYTSYTLPPYRAGWGYAASVLDIDADGLPDVVLMPPADITNGPVPQPMLLMKNEGNRTFTGDATVFPIDFRRDWLRFAFAGDFDGDGQEDIIVIGEFDMAFLRRVGPMRFEYGAQAFPALPGGRLEGTRGLVADFDGDGDLDFLLGRGSWFPLEDVVYVNDGSGRFSPGFSFPALDTHCLDVGDVNGDGHIDVVNSTMRGRQPLWLNDGQGNFIDASDRVGTLPRSTSWGATGVALRDIDGDGHLDLMFASGTRGVEVWINDGRGRFTDMSSAYGWTAPASGLRVADLDRDGDLDVSFSTLFASPVYKNLTRHVDATDPVRGSAWPIDIYSRPGWSVSYAVGFGRAALRLPPYGWWGLDLGSTVAFPGTLTVPPTGKVTSTLPVPADTALRGLDIFVQAVEFDIATPNSIRLTNTDGSVIR